VIQSRPWGGWELLHKSDTYAVKRLLVNPKSRLSLQYHDYREEHWYCVAGRGIVTIDGREISISTGQSVTVPQGAVHRIENHTENEPLIIVEVWHGVVLEESDITRLEDDYDRDIEI